MKKLLTIATLGLAAILSCGASAFAADGDQTNANIPFDFTVGDQQFAAGKYNLEQMGSALILRRLDGKQSAMLHTETTSHLKPSTANELSFERQGSELVLRSVKREGSSEEVQVVAGTSKSHRSDAVAAASAK